MSAALLNAELVTGFPVPSDRELIERFVRIRDQAAFGELVRRHSSIVIGVGRRVLHDPNDIDDVFQATFIVLVQNAGRIRHQTSVASWLYGVAYRLSLRVARQRQRRREKPLVDETAHHDDPFGKMADRHEQQIVDLELNALPERYRQPLVLRYLSGKSTSEVATELEITVGAAEGLIKRGKDELRRRLLQRGITLAAVFTAIQYTQQAVHAAEMESLIEATTQASLAWKSGSNSAATDPVSDRVGDLAIKEILTMTIATKPAFAVGLTLGALVIGLYTADFSSGRGTGNVQAAGLATTMSSASPAVLSTRLIDLAPETSRHDIKLADATRDHTDRDHTDSQPGEEEEDDEQIPLSLAVQPPGQWDYKPRSATELKIENELRANTEVNFTDTPLNEVLDFLEDRHGIEILIDSPSLEDDGISEDQVVSLVLSGVSLKSVLNTLLEPLQLDFVIRNEVMVIMSRRKAAELFETRVYRLNQLPDHSPLELAETIKATIAPDCWNTPLESATASPGEHPLGTPLDRSIEGAADRRAARASAEIMPLSAGGGGSSSGSLGTIRATGKTLVIRQTQRIHNEIIDLLEQLKRTSSEDE